MTKKIVLFFFSISCFALFSQEKLTQEDFEKLKSEIKKELEEENLSHFNWRKFSLSGYGVINYYNYGTYDTDPEIRNKIDAERLNLYLGYKFSDKISLKTEFEFEHGGTGSTMEFDVYEESGEFETETEAGGEVKLEQVHIDFKIQPYFNVRLGRMKLHFNLAQNLDRPTEYFTTHRQEMENEILPLGWYENGVQFYGTFLKNFRYEFSITNGLNSMNFSSKNWIKGGHQLRFEMVNADSFAFTGRLDYLFGKNKNTFVGVGAYFNDTAKNRFNNDIEKEANVTILTGHISYNENNLRFNSSFIWGNLQNSDLISQNNRYLPNAYGAKRNAVAKNVIGFSAELGYNLLPLIVKTENQKLYPFVRYDFYDTMNEVAGAIIKNDFWKRNSLTSGVNWFITDQIVLKAQYQARTYSGNFYNYRTSKKLDRKAQENTFSVGIAFSF